MVSVTHSIDGQINFSALEKSIGKGLSSAENAIIAEALIFAENLYGAQSLRTGESAFSHGLGMALIASGLQMDVDARIAALLFSAHAHGEMVAKEIKEQFGEAVLRLTHGLFRLSALSPILNKIKANEDKTAQEAASKTQGEILRKMLLAMADDIRVVILRLASRTQTLRFFAANQKVEEARKIAFAEETHTLYAPLANRLGVWELKWEMEDLAFRFMSPDIYRSLAKSLDGKRIEREQFIENAVLQLKTALFNYGIKNAEVYGRPKHIYSIWRKMQLKNLEFAQVFDVRALRIIVKTVDECYGALALVHELWQAISGTFDDYIASPKGNNYRSLHTAVNCADGNSLEVQIRTREMHEHAELGVAAHWRYKEGSTNNQDRYNDKIAALRQLVEWKNEVSESREWVSRYKEAALDEVIYVSTPEGKVIDLPRGATPLDFAYKLHTELGHRCRGARVNGALIPLNTPLENTQTVEILVAKEGNPSLDWLMQNAGFVTTNHARGKIRRWFANLAQEESIATGKALLHKELQRLGQTSVNLENLAAKLNFAKTDDLFIALTRADISSTQLKESLLPEESAPSIEQNAPLTFIKTARENSHKGVLIVGVENVLTQLANCCKPAPPDEIAGFVTRGKGVSVHRAHCADFLHLYQKSPERVIETAWSANTSGVFAVDIFVEADDRQGLLHDVSEILTREKINVIAVKTQSKKGVALMNFTTEVENVARLTRAFAEIAALQNVRKVAR